MNKIQFNSKEVYISRIILVIISLLVSFLGACSKTVQAPIPVTESNPTEDPIFSTLDFATTGSDVGHGLAANNNGLYIVGYTSGSLDGTNQGNNDGFLRHYNGLKIWAKQFGTRNNDFPIKVATNSNGDVYVMGQTGGPLGFRVGSNDVFLAKFNKDGELLWGKQFGTKGADTATDLAIDNNDRIYVLSNEGPKNFVIRKFGSGGSLIKTKSVTLNNRPGLVPRAITIDSLNRLTVLTDWNNSGGARGIDIRLFKYTSGLNQLWQKAYSTTDDDFAHDITTDSNNNIYLTFKILAASKGAHFIKKDPDGNTLYSRRLEYSNISWDTTPESITIDGSNNIYIAGHTSGSFSGFTNAGFKDIVVFKYSSSGTEQWISQFDSNNYGSENSDYANDIVVNGSVYVTGSTSGNLLVGSGSSYGGADAYVAELRKGNGTIVGVDQ